MQERYADIDEIRHLAHFHRSECSCGRVFEYHVLQIYAQCPGCERRSKVRAFGGIGTEIQDVIDAVLAWAGEGREFDAVMERRRVILEDRDDPGEPA